MLDVNYLGPKLTRLLSPSRSSPVNLKLGGQVSVIVREAQRLHQLEDENQRLKKLVADLSLDKDMLKAVIEKNEWSS